MSDAANNTSAAVDSHGTTSNDASSSSAASPVTILMVGMAGSGKTTLVQRIHAELRMRKKNPYLMNLDPAVVHLPYGANIDIRDTVNYKEVMKQYNLGPNGAIVTSLNLFATRFDQVVSIVKKKTDAGAHTCVRAGSSADRAQPPSVHIAYRCTCHAHHSAHTIVPWTLQPLHR